MDPILSQLNEAQREAVKNIEGPVMVIAGAGSGKTRVLTYRIAYMISQGIDPFNILALTFTNKAAREMKDRMLRLVNNREAGNVWMGTFHSIFARVLRVEGRHLGYESNFAIYDNEDSKRLLKDIVKNLNLDPKVYTPSWLLNRISAAKSSLIGADEYNSSEELATEDRKAQRPEAGRIYKIYQDRLFQSQAMDFDDLLFNMYRILKDFPEILYKYQERFRYILVDEYQDTNYAQYLILKQLAARYENICVVGDDAQSIYAFRGANIRNILNFKNDYPDYQLFKIEQNYRSTQIIVEAANGVIAHNKEQIFKKVWTQNEEGDKIRLLKATSDNEEGQLIANTIFELKMNLQLNNDAFAVLYRTNAQSRAIEEALRKANIPYRIYGGLSFYKRKEIKDLVAYFRLVVNPMDGDALKRIINYPTRGIGDTTMDKAERISLEQGIPLWEVISNPHRYSLDIRGNTLAKMDAFVNMILKFHHQVKTRSAYELAKDITQASGILRELEEDKTPEGVARVDNIEELLNAISDFAENDQVIPGIDDDESVGMRTLDVFLQDIALYTDADEKDDGTPKVALMTIHAAKGLEFPFVFVSGMEENLFPNIQALNSRSELEEERRLFYVAITRAQKRLFLSFALTRYVHGQLNYCEPSRFLEEIDEKFIEMPRKVKMGRDEPAARFVSSPQVQSASAKVIPSTDPSKLKKMNSALSAVGNPGSDELIRTLQVGMQVHHERFGEGKVISLEGEGPNRKATIFFPGVGQKQLLLKFAKLKII
ncbi:MAG: UvrD-helicase domain-containing protein [Bacteroidales bacterium]